MKKNCIVGGLIIILWCFFILWGMLFLREHGNVIVTESEFCESSRELTNPNCGFYYMHGFYISDEPMDFRHEIARRFCTDENTTLTMIQINLAYYSKGDISPQGLENIRALFEALKTVDKQLIVRFLYDWDGNCEGKEPEKIQTILRHMEQTGPIVADYSDRIFTLQGLFIGNWGEMNGTPFTGNEDIQILAETLFRATEGKVYMAVRMPMFWRRAVKERNRVCVNGIFLEDRLGLYNDGMLGSYSDYGTYGNESGVSSGELEPWNRKEELAFQDILCASVPQGGEVIIDNEYNDIENAVTDFRKMHVSYLNRDFDQNVYNKWRGQIVHTGDCFDGMDGMSYMERHLGYRLFIDGADISYDWWKDELKLAVALKNSGFAPVYKETYAAFLIVDTQSGELHRFPVDVSLSSLTGGGKEAIASVEGLISLTGLAPKEYDLYFQLRDTASGQILCFANEQDVTEYGYHIGSAVLQKISWYERD